ncbi:RNA polymerase sigma factor [Polyangium fumosum]|uniref:RNA polymerase sigma factor n=1 Tax=Polyangium fumosum TaxID=889272 RepID=UPI0014790002|nr:sigma-70 family RNA polymerase sigma factor [Polyangium fumosum]
MARVVELRPDVERFLASRRKGRENDDSLEDEVQVVMTEAIASVPSYREDEGDLKSWVLGIAANIAKRAERTRQRDAVLTTEDGAVSVLSPLASPERLARMHELRRKVGLVLQAMPEPLFIVLYLVCIDEKSHQEAAELLEITEEASRKRLQDARAYVERESGISRDELRVVFPFCVASEEDELREGAAALDKLFPFFWRGGEFLVVWIIAALSWPSPSLHTARAGLSVPAVHVATAASAPAVIEIAPAPPVDVPAHAPSSAKESAKPPAARPKPAGPVETARGAAAATTEKPFLDKVTDLEFRRR